jgi:hypothetical protein
LVLLNPRKERHDGEESRKEQAREEGSEEGSGTGGVVRALLAKNKSASDYLIAAEE